MKRFCSVVDLRVGNVIRVGGEVVAVCKEPHVIKATRLGETVTLNQQHHHIDVVDSRVQRYSVNLPIFHFVELIK